MKLHLKKEQFCLNCGYVFKDENNFCPKCGQENHSLKVPFKHLVHEFIEGFLHIDTKAINTFKALILKPGYLPHQYNSGKRVSFIPPVRIYIFVSFVFFLLLNFTSGHKESGHEKKDGTSQASGFELNVGGVKSDSAKGLNEAQFDSLLEARKVQGKFTKFVATQAKKIASGGKQEFMHSMYKNLSYMMFLLMPLFAFYLYMFHLKDKHFYIEHLIFSIHFHSYIFLLGTVYIVLSFYFTNSNLFFIIPSLCFIYLFLALRRIFAQKTYVTALKAIALFIIHGITVLFSFVLVVLISVLLF